MDHPLSADPPASGAEAEEQSLRSNTAGPVITFSPARQTVPLVFASPHSGRAYPADFVAAARLDPLTLRRSEDGFVDELFAAAPHFGAPLIAATFPRAYCDPNREPWELDPAMFEEPLPVWVNTKSPRVGAGLGTIARIVSSGETIYRKKLRFAEAERRVRQFWEPYHDQLSRLVENTKMEFGACLLIDCHSMPCSGYPKTSSTRSLAEFVLGDVHGTTCCGYATDFVERALAGMGYVVRRNDPYAGGYVTRHYGRPREGLHALQIEIARSLYMDEARIERSPDFAALHHDVTRLIASLARAAAALIGGRIPNRS